MIKPLTVAATGVAGQKTVVNVVGRFFRCREASAAFKLKVGSDTYTLEGGDEFVVRDSDKAFTSLTFINLSADEDLLVDFFAGNNVVQNAYVKLPRTQTFGRELTATGLNDTQDFPGVVDGKRRKQFTITVRKGLIGSVLLYNSANGELLAIISGVDTAGVGFAIETDFNLQIKNRITTPAVMQNTSATAPDIAIAETFYK